MMSGMETRLILAAVAMLVVACDQRDPRAYTGSERMSAETVNANELWSAYRGNEVAADERFRGKPFNLVGEVVEVRKAFGSTVISLRAAGSNSLTHVEARGVDQRRAARMKLGERVRLFCVGDGLTLGSPQANCE